MYCIVYFCMNYLSVLCHLQADPGKGMEQGLKSLLVRVEGLEAQMTLLVLDNSRISHVNDVLSERIASLEAQNADFKLENERLVHTQAALSKSLKIQKYGQQQDVKRLARENERLSHATADLKQRVDQLEAINSQQTAALNPSPEPDTRSQFTALACTFDVATMSCSNNRTILTTSAVYGRYVETCGDCCAPNPENDCTEIVEENRPSDWLAIQALCDGKTSCQFENPGNALSDCSNELSDYMQLFYDCLPDDSTELVAFTAWANTGNPTSYNTNDNIIFDQVLTNAGGHYNAATSSFICPWDGIYLISVNMEGGPSNDIHVDLMQNDVMLARVHIDEISGGHNRGSTTIVTECGRGDVVWVRAGSDGTIWAPDCRNMFTGHILYRF